MIFTINVFAVLVAVCNSPFAYAQSWTQLQDLHPHPHIFTDDSFLFPQLEINLPATPTMAQMVRAQFKSQHEEPTSSMASSVARMTRTRTIVSTSTVLVSPQKRVAAGSVEPMSMESSSSTVQVHSSSEDTNAISSTSTSLTTEDVITSTSMAFIGSNAPSMVTIVISNMPDDLSSSLLEPSSDVRIIESETGTSPSSEETTSSVINNSSSISSSSHEEEIQEQSAHSSEQSEADFNSKLTSPHLADRVHDSQWLHPTTLFINELSSKIVVISFEDVTSSATPQQHYHHHFSSGAAAAMSPEHSINDTNGFLEDEVNAVSNARRFKTKLEIISAFRDHSEDDQQSLPEETELPSTAPTNTIQLL